MTPEPLTTEDRIARMREGLAVAKEAGLTVASFSVEGVAALLQEKERLERDAARLNWLETMTVNVREGKYADTNVFWRHPKKKGDPSLREAIDSARGVPSEQEQDQ